MCARACVCVCVSSALHYNSSVPKDAFLCVEHGTSVSGTIHASVVDRTRTMMTCTSDPANHCSALTKEHLVWFRSSVSGGEQLTTQVFVLSSQDVTVWMTLCTACMYVHLTVFVAFIDASSSGATREPPCSVAMHHPGGVLTTGEWDCLVLYSVYFVVWI